jgi:hypothetical protein
MSDEKLENALTRYASRQTSPAEETALLRAAAEDQDIFDALAQEELMREILDDPSARKMLLKSLPAERTGIWAAITQFMQPKTIFTLAGATTAAAIALTFVVNREPVTDKTFEAKGTIQQSLSSMEPTPEAVKQAFATYAQSTRPNDGTLKLELNKKSYKRDDELRVTFVCDIEAKLVLVIDTADGRSHILFPNQWTRSAQVPAGYAQSAPPATVRPILLDAPPGKMHVTIAAFPADSDVGQPVTAVPAPLAVMSTDVDVSAK